MTEQVPNSLADQGGVAVQHSATVAAAPPPSRVAQLAASWDCRIAEQATAVAVMHLKHGSHTGPSFWLAPKPGQQRLTAVQRAYSREGEGGQPPALVQAVLSGDAARLAEVVASLQQDIEVQQHLQDKAAAAARQEFSDIINGQWTLARIVRAAALQGHGDLEGRLHVGTTLLLLASALAQPAVAAALLDVGADPLLVDCASLCCLTAALAASHSSPQDQRALVQLLLARVCRLSGLPTSAGSSRVPAPLRISPRMRCPARRMAPASASCDGRTTMTCDRNWWLSTWRGRPSTGGEV